MSTRSKAAALKNAIVPVATTPKPSSSKKPGPKPRGRPKKSIDPVDKDQTGGEKEPKLEKENGKASAATKAKGKAATTIHPKAVAVKKVMCVCKRPDDGTPMVNCGECNKWYHFACVDLDEREAEDIGIYICPSCTEKTGRRTVMDWEGPEALEEILVVDPASLFDEPISDKLEEPIVDDAPEAPSESDAGPSSEDEYVAAPKSNGKGNTKRRTRRLSFSSDESASENDTRVASGSKKPSSRNRRASAAKPAHASSPADAGYGHLKRKPTTTHAPAAHPPPAKKKKPSNTNTAQDDPTRRYCLGKLEEVFFQIFNRYPRQAENERTDGAEPVAMSVDAITGTISDEEKTRIGEEAKKFTTEIEQCVYDTYSEPDKLGNPSAGPKYKERFRMLQFNLSKPDRVVLHKRIASSQISAKELSLMSSTDLANEETQQSIKIAEKEALEHSILQMTKVPTAKITHKGLENIEDRNPEIIVSSQAEQEDEERRERERRDRLRVVQAQEQRHRSASVTSVPPESPAAQQSSSWGAPLPLPAHITEYVPSMSTGFDESSMFMDGPSDLGEPEMNLADLINIDEDPQETPPTEMVVSPPTATSTAVSPPTGISPFAANVEPPSTPVRSASFDLNSFWSAPRPEAFTASEQTTASNSPLQTTSSPKTFHNDENETFANDFLSAPDVTEETDDQDFDMFLEDAHDNIAVDTSPEALRAVFDSKAPVWSGMINMPLDSTIPQETPVVARQIGGRKLESDSPLWRTLFPAKLLRIDGRVPVESSSQFLLQMRMNPTKELIAVAFVPGSEGQSGFQILSDFLIAKGRHGLVFPWGSRPRDHHPGKELYIIPLLSSNPLPDYIELLDELQLPKTRVANYLVGIWVLNKGKLAPPPEEPASVPLPFAQPPPQSAPPPPQSEAQPPNERSEPEVFHAAQPPPPEVYQGAQPPAASLSPAPHAVTMPLPMTIPPNLNIAPETLAAEVASLTPDQIQLMLRTLSSTMPLLPPTGPPQPPQNFPPFPPFNGAQQWANQPGPPGPMGYNQASQPPPFAYNQHQQSQRPPFGNGPPQFNQRGGHAYDGRGGSIQSPNQRGGGFNRGGGSFRGGNNNNNGYERRPSYGNNNNNRGSYDYGQGGNSGDRRGGRGRGRGGSGRGDAPVGGRDSREPPIDSGWASRRNNQGGGGSYNN